MPKAHRQKTMKIQRATLIAEIPIERFRLLDQNTTIPKIGDVVVLDQGFTSKNGEACCLVYGTDQDGKYMYEAEVFESEIGDNVTE